ncbi:hypothetical protein AGABI2DRAFT_118809 [Agaricus bisporus var. bisporus H97]|uniref:hypothetical protein n=1 Tax=Agaricus bisporus var. bisporus (strain H97 / ATCC MYA-4626 / FGSC 10389) TaxID=936046 RepID=UPI00029F7BEB|nr:hypothetical protein AGABI2DRAFT_118809 [Agaricus bisporus var. bisporus H97]EKV46634.1 hypothetical protein AGABI2DRAFT_118809 [Agaricus bisporus var. bisporus H97]
MPPYKSLYDILGVDKSASSDEVRKAYRKKVLQTHPDRLGLHLSAADRRAAETQFHLIQNAFETLSDPHRRKAYDAWGNKADPKVSKEELTKRRAERDAWASRLAEGYERRRNQAVPPIFIPTPRSPNAQSSTSNSRPSTYAPPETRNNQFPPTPQATSSSEIRNKPSPIVRREATGPLSDEEEDLIAEMLQEIRAQLPPEYEERRRKALQKKAERETADMSSRTVPV